MNHLVPRKERLGTAAEGGKGNTTLAQSHYQTKIEWKEKADRMVHGWWENRFLGRGERKETKY